MGFLEKINSVFQKKPYRKKKRVQSSFKNFLRDYFTFNSKQRNGSIALLGTIFFVTTVIFSYRLRNSQQVTDTSAFQKEVDEFLASAVVKEDAGDEHINFIAGEISSPSKPPAQLFVFNPNTATEADFVKLGLTQKQAAGIINYRSKGGQFRKKEDFAKMYSLREGDYERLEPFISIPEPVKEEKIFEEKKIYESKPREKVLVEINTADSIDLIKVKGIGAYTAMKIIELRTKLGGFYSKEQLKEVYRVDSARYAEIEPFLTVDPFEVKQININTASLEELKAHPYIRYNIANSIISIRQQHGNYISIEGIKKSHLVTEDVFRKIAPYLTIEASP